MNHIATFLQYADVVVLAVFDAGFSAFIFLMVTFATGMQRVGRVILVAALLSLVWNLCIGGRALWSGSRGLGLVAWLAGHMIVVFLVAGAAVAAVAKRSQGAPPMAERAWSAGWLGWLAMTAIVVVFVVVDGALALRVGPAS